MRHWIAAIVFLDVLFFAAALYFLARDRAARRREKRIEAFVRPGAGRTSGPPCAGEARPDSRTGGLLDRVAAAAGIEAMLLAADLPLSPERFVSLSLAVTFLLIIPALVLYPHPLLVVVLLACGLSLPFAYLIRRRRRREETLVRQLPDMLDMMVRALRVGQPVDGALREVGQSFAAPIGTEIRTVHEEIAMGVPFAEALRRFDQRFAGVPEVKIICTAMIIQRQTGGNLTRLLSGLSQTIRERFQLKKQVQATTAEGRVSALILGLLPVAFILFAGIANPAYIGVLFTDPLGKKLLLLALGFEAAGFAVMRWMTRLDY